jgi:hypothetical protein
MVSSRKATSSVRGLLLLHRSSTDHLNCDAPRVKISFTAKLKKGESYIDTVLLGWSDENTARINCLVPAVLSYRRIILLYTAVLEKYFYILQH